MVDPIQVQSALEALRALLKVKDDALNIIDQPEKIDLQFAFAKVPQLKNKQIALTLPHSIHNDSREVCLFVKDLDSQDRDYEKTVHHFENLFRQYDISCIAKVVPLKALRTDYSMPHLKRNLAKAYDLFLADERIIGMLPGILGKIFYAKKRTVPVQVNLTARNLKKQLENLVHNSRCELQGTGSSSMVTIAHVRMNDSDIVENITAAAHQVMRKAPGGKNNIRNMYIKGTNSEAVPIYMSFGDSRSITVPSKTEEKLETFLDDITTVQNAKVAVSADGHVQVISNKRKRAYTRKNKISKKKRP